MDYQQGQIERRKYHVGRSLCYEEYQQPRRYLRDQMPAHEPSMFHAVHHQDNKADKEMTHLMRDFICSRHTTRFEPYPFVIDTFCNVISRIKVATQQRLQATDYRTTCVPLERHSDFLLVDRRNLTLR